MPFWSLPFGGFWKQLVYLNYSKDFSKNRALYKGDDGRMLRAICTFDFKMRTMTGKTRKTYLWEPTSYFSYYSYCSRPIFPYPRDALCLVRLLEQVQREQKMCKKRQNMRWEIIKRRWELRGYQHFEKNTFSIMKAIARLNKEMARVEEERYQCSLKHGCQSCEVPIEHVPLM